MLTVVTMNEAWRTPTATINMGDTFAGRSESTQNGGHKMSQKDFDKLSGVSRRTLLQDGAGLAGGAMLPTFSTSLFAADQPPIGTWPDGSSGSSVTLSIAVPRTGTYAVQGEDELKGWELAVEHMNSGHELMKKFSPKTTKGVLGKEVKMVVADSGAKPNTAVQAHQRAITENKAVLLT